MTNPYLSGHTDPTPGDTTVAGRDPATSDGSHFTRTFTVALVPGDSGVYEHSANMNEVLRDCLRRGLQPSGAVSVASTTYIPPANHPGSRAHVAITYSVAATLTSGVPTYPGDVARNTTTLPTS